MSDASGRPHRRAHRLSRAPPPRALRYARDLPWASADLEV